jgi:hypothetical protein
MAQTLQTQSVIIGDTTTEPDLDDPNDRFGAVGGDRRGSLASGDRKPPSSKYIGVTWCKSNNKWKAQIGAGGKNHFIGNFDDEEAAAKAYDAAAKKLIGEDGLARRVKKRENEGRGNMNPSAESNIPVGGLAIPGGVYAMEPVPLADSAETKRCKCGSAPVTSVFHIQTAR